MKQLIAFLSLMLLALGCSGKDIYRLRFAEQPVSRKQQLRSPVPPFLIVSDTQYAVPFTDYDLRYQLGQQYIDLPPVLSTMASKSFYRNAEAHLAVPLALDAVLARSEGSYEFGLFGGDMAEFSCKHETQRLFDVLAAHPNLPFIVTIGNHDAEFHGSYDTAASSTLQSGDWDLYSFNLWGAVCQHEGGRLTKSGFIRQILDYYAKVWKLDYRQLLEGKELAAGQNAHGVLARRDSHGVVWQLELDVELAFEEGREAHRQSHLYQRFTRFDPEGKSQPTVFTSLDTTDYRQRPILCSTSSKLESTAQRLVQIGLGGAVSDEQVTWLEDRPVGGSSSHFVLSHYLPFEDVEGMDSCDTTFGTHCLGRRLMTALSGATYIYGHVHQEFKEGYIERKGCEKRVCGHGPCLSSEEQRSACASLARNPIVRIPSFIDNKAYVAFDGDYFRSQSLKTASSDLTGAAPFSEATTTCDQRVREYIELKGLIQCIRTAAGKAPSAACLDAKKSVLEAKQLSPQLCQQTSAAWISENGDKMTRYSQPPPATPNPPSAPSTVLPASAGVCAGWAPFERWRCILRGLAYDAVTETNLPANEQSKLGEQLLSAVIPLRAKPGPKPEVR